MKINERLITALVAVLICFSACKRDDYFSGGSLHNSKVDMTTYDYLKGNSRGLFDTLILLIDKAGLKDKINQSNVTFFAPTDYSINNYLSSRTKEEQNVDPFRQWSIDSLIKYELPKFADSINAYLVSQPLSYDMLSNDGAIFATQKPSVNCVVSYEFTKDPNLGYNQNTSNVPQVIYYTLLKQPLSPPFVAAEIPATVGTRVRVQSSGIQTTTGVVDVLEGGHFLFFRTK